MLCIVFFAYSGVQHTSWNARYLPIKHMSAEYIVGLGHEAMVCAVCLTMFFLLNKNKKSMSPLFHHNMLRPNDTHAGYALKTKTGYGKYRKMKANLSSFGSLLTITVGNGSMAHDYQPITMEFEVAGLPVAVCLSKPNDELCYPLPIWITWISTQPWKSLCRIYDTLVHIILLKYDAI